MITRSSTEVKATLAAARLSPYRQIRVLFQPHRFSRTKHLLDEFGTAFHQADDLYLLDIYAASEPEIEGVTTESLLEKIRSYGHRSAHYARSMEEGIAAISAASGAGDLIVTLGAGNVAQPQKRFSRSCGRRRSGAHCTGARRTGILVGGNPVGPLRRVGDSWPVSDGGHTLCVA